MNSTESGAIFWHGSLNNVLTFVLAVLVVWIVFKLYQVFGIITMLLKEIVFLLWNITFSRSTHHLSKPLRLHTYVCETSYLDEVGVHELYHFFREDFSSTYSAKDLHNILLKYTDIIMLRDQIDGTLRGAVAVGVEHREDYTQIVVGLANFKDNYRGSPFFNITVFSFLLREICRRPRTPVYLITKLFGCKPYVFAANVNGTYPRYNRETPEELKKLMDKFGEMYVWTKGGSAKYNPETNVIEQEQSHLAENLTTLSEQDLKNPHIKFFVKRNPGWKMGHCLVASHKVTWSSFLQFACISMMKVLKRQRQCVAAAVPGQNGSTRKSEVGEVTYNGQKKKSTSSELHKKLTANSCAAVNNLNYSSMVKEVKMSPKTGVPFLLQAITEPNIPGSTELPTLT